MSRVLFTFPASTLRAVPPKSNIANWSRLQVISHPVVLSEWHVLLPCLFIKSPLLLLTFNLDVIVSGKSSLTLGNLSQYVFLIEHLSSHIEITGFTSICFFVSTLVSHIERSGKTYSVWSCASVCVWSLQSCPTLWHPIGSSPPWDFPGKNTEVCCHFHLQGNFLTKVLNPGLLVHRWILYQLSYQGSPLHSPQFILNTLHFNVIKWGI